MLFILNNLKGGVTLYFYESKEYSIGRKDCDFVLTNDKSISRKHAIIKLENNEVYVTDCGSTYFTFHNSNKIEANTKINIKVGDEIKFGAYDCIFKLESKEFFVTSSQLSTFEKNIVSKCIKELRGKHVDVWSSKVTHVTVSKITLTVKVLQATVDGIPLVVPKYWQKFIECMNKRIPPPQIEDYKPGVAEAALRNVSFEYNPKRLKLFHRKCFIFAKERSKSQMEDIIKKLGGQCISWEEKRISLEKIKIICHQIIYIQMPDENTFEPSLQEVIDYMKSQNRRLIPLPEIALAIVQCSCEKDCNPGFNRVDNVFNNQETPNKSAPVLVAQSETLSENVEPVKNVKEDLVLPESIDLDEEDDKCSVKDSQVAPQLASVAFDNKKRPSCDNDKDLVLNPYKKKKTEIHKENTSSFLSKSSSQLSQPKSSFKPASQATSLYSSLLSQSKSTPKMASQSGATSKVKENPFSSKRKAAENPSNQPESKKPNPFAFKAPEAPEAPAKKKVNPFAKQPTVKEEPDVEEPPPKKCREVFTSTQIDQNTTAKPFEVSCVSVKVEKPCWLSKETTSRFEKVKKVYDEEIESIIRLFEERASVEVIPMDMSNVRSYSFDATDSVSSVCNGKKNFKKFVKVLPKRPQRRIISTADFIANGANDTQGISVNMLNFQDEDESPKKKEKSHTLKKFHFI
ncbi:unnamed protein product [Brassicogethes aeneus]|uniref:FHA domain-containing protein n=1 Tax=Brassicogethes aeneus TaxID=1431903 RepID=A0A9P0B6S3_BRAAE|nr:unnamed protein product [Brassicogethes aeneus]